MEENLCDLGLVKKNLIFDTENIICKQKNCQMDFIKIQNLCSVRNIVQKIVFKSQTRRKYLKITHLKKELYQVFKGQKRV